MHVLAPSISCLCFPNEVQAAIDEGYKQIYIATSKGFFKHHILRGEGRYVRVKVDSIPGYTEPKVEESMSFLPAGKVPYELYEQILAFFKKVMEVNTSEVEAMIHVLWNPEQGYHLGVPPQRISKASVSYDWNYVPAGTSIVVDIHSHNTMGAFFSGTDNNDDRNNISYSGVFGKLKDPEPMTVWRFNYTDKKYSANLSDIFDAPPKAEVAVPQEWLDKVEVQTYQYPSYRGYQGGNSNQGNVGRWHGPTTGPSSNTTQTTGNTHSHLSKHELPKASNVSQQGSQQSPAAAANKHVYIPGQDDEDFNYSSFFGHEGSGEEFEQLLLGGFGGTQVAKGLILPDDIDDIPDPNPQVIEDALAEGATSVGKSTRELETSEEGNGSRSIISTDPAYRNVAVLYGTDAADTWWDIGNMMADLHGNDELLSELTADMFQLVDESQQVKLLSLLFENMSEKAKAQIETTGFV